MVPETVYTNDSFFLFHFLHVVNYKSVNWEPFSTDWLWRQNLKTCVKCKYHVATMMKWKTVVSTFFIFVYIFSFEDPLSSLEPLFHTKLHDKYILTTHPPKMSNWYFAWQNGWMLPLIDKEKKFQLKNQSINQSKYISLPNKKYSYGLLQCYHESLSTYLW